MFDFAGFVKLSKNYSAGINLQNLGMYENLPINLKAGICYKDSFIKTGLDINAPYKSSVIFNFGSEITILDNLFLRGGLKYKVNEPLDFLANATAGFGLKFDMFSVDYGFKMYDVLGNTHFISLIVNLK